MSVKFVLSYPPRAAVTRKSIARNKLDVRHRVHRRRGTTFVVTVVYYLLEQAALSPALIYSRVQGQNHEVRNKTMNATGK